MIFDLLEEVYEDPMDGVVTILQVVFGCVATITCVLVGVIL